MKGWLIGGLLAVGLLLIFVATGTGRDNTGDTVRAQAWASDVCRTVATWEGSLKDIRKELQKNSYGARNADGGSGDGVEGNVTVREAVDRAVVATDEHLTLGLEQAGIPDSPQGGASAATLRAWATRTEDNLLLAQARLKREPAADSIAGAALQTLAVPITALTRSVLDGRTTLQRIGTTDPELAQAFQDSNTCRRLQRRTA
ncbi:hypothetical protein DSM104299_01801 [Baekduia alba]|uniref:hypothetical protein n=1 Tax=Baekduia alba TaxID=2997333 RepID=UPI0023409940|nr:hypothetical protein [Baekduia alba]WCB93099.1 hypothetical protein DSM104299_01801 [Baekduia alba]